MRAGKTPKAHRVLYSDGWRGMPNAKVEKPDNGADWALRLQLQFPRQAVSTSNFYEAINFKGGHHEF